MIVSSALFLVATFEHDFCWSAAAIGFLRIICDVCKMIHYNLCDPISTFGMQSLRMLSLNHWNSSFSEIIYVTVIIGSICLSGAVPLFFELTCEAAYPIGERVTNGFVALLNNVAALLFMLGLMVPGNA